VKGKFLVADYDCVASVVAALVANYIVNSVTKEVCGFAFAFVSPLGSD
jgi:hypothetical protein